MDICPTILVGVWTTECTVLPRITEFRRTCVRVVPTRIIAVSNQKGGVGKTWFSISLSHAFALKKSKVLLFDADLGLANVDIQLGLMPQRDIGGVISGKLSLSQAKIRYEQGKFDVVAGRSGSGNLAALPPTQLNNLGNDLVELSSNYDKVIMDLGAGIDRTVRNLAYRAKTIIVIATTEPTSLTDAYAFVKLSIQTNPSADIRIVINNCASHIEGQRTCLLYTSPSPRDRTRSRMPSSA